MSSRYFTRTNQVKNNKGYVELHFDSTTPLHLVYTYNILIIEGNLRLCSQHSSRFTRDMLDYTTKVPQISFICYTNTFVTIGKLWAK